MEQILFIVAMLMLGSTILLVIAAILSNGVRVFFDLTSNYMRMAVFCFAVYIISFGIYFVINN
ncbi:hypothetical protein SFC66_15365 [Terribacillus saccharophilus]|uniref:hypothetical protein n=1 Tax=Terribacillus saccharophilus TaxID=361277 RepID=UPI0039819DDE